MKARLVSYSLLILAGLLYACALKYFVLPSEVILTGTEGVAASISYYLENYTVFIILYLCFQAVMLIFAFFKVSRLFAYRTFTVVATVTAALAVLPELQFAQPEPQNERIILVIFGGLLAGAAKAIAFRNSGSSGDEDVMGAYFAMKYLKPVGFIAIFAGISSTAFGIVLNIMKHGDFESAVNTLMYTCIYIFVSAEVLNNFYRKFKLSMLTIFAKDTSKVEEALRSLSQHRTYTLQTVQGGYSGAEFSALSTIVTHEELPLFIESVQQAEPGAFFYHNDIEGISPGYYITPIG